MLLTYLSHKDGADFSPERHGRSLKSLKIIIQILWVGGEISLGEMFRKELEDGENLEWAFCLLG